MEINGVAHVVLRANRYEECIPFYDRLMAELGPQAVHRDDSFVYYGGGRTALQIRRAPRALDHLCFRARSRQDVDELYPLLQSIGADVVRAAEEGPGHRAGTRCPFAAQRGSAWRSITFPARGCWPRTRHVTPRRVTR